MKILIVDNFHYLRGGSERAAFDMASILEKHGHETAYFAMAHPKNRPNKWSKYFTESFDLSDRHSLLDKFKIVSRIFYNFKVRKNLGAMMREFKPDIAHLHNIYHHLSPSVIDELKKNNIPVVMTLHDNKLICPNYSLFARGKIWEKSNPDKYYRCFLDKCVKDSYSKSLICTIEAYLHKWLGVYDKIDAFISPSRYLIAKFREFRFKHDISHLPNPILDFSGGRSSDDGDYFLYFGRLSPEKSVDDLIQAFSRIETGMKLKIIGEGPDRARLENIARTSGASLSIEFAGYQSGDDLWENVRKARAVVVPSRWSENFPYTVIEAMSYGKIVIASEVGGITEQIKNGQTGFLYKAGDVDRLASLLREVSLMDNEEKKLIGDNALVSVKEMCGQEVFYKNLIAIYMKILK